MRRVAAELGAGTMTLYHYVRTKDELLALVDNAVMGELLIPPDEVPDGWRAGMREIAHRTRATFARHPWIVEMPRNIDGGPNGTRHFEQSLAVIAETGLPVDECLELVLLVDDYVFGYIQRFNADRRARRREPRGGRRQVRRRRPRRGSRGWTSTPSRTCARCSRPAPSATRSCA